MAYMIDKEMTTMEQDAEEQDDDLSRLVDKCAALTLKDGKFSDAISLYCMSGGKSVKVHKCMLAQSSPVFATMLIKAEMKQNIVEIVDVTYDVLKEMIRFVYSGKVRNIDALAVELATAADSYALNGLKNMCEETMTENLSLDNVILYLRLADRLRMDKLKGKAIEFIVRNERDVFLYKPEMKSLPENIIAEILVRLQKANSHIYHEFRSALGKLY